MSILVLTSDTLIGTPATGNLEYNGQFFGTDSAGSRAQLQRIVRATAVASTSGTSIDFTNIPAWVQRLTVMFDQVSTNGTSAILIQLGDSGGVETTGYLSNSTYTGPGSGGTSSTAGIIVFNDDAARNPTGHIVFTNISGNTWIASGVTTPVALGSYTYQTAGVKTLSATLDRVRITTVSGTPTFDAGSVNILYEG
jgi:hypothetical protein